MFRSALLAAGSGTGHSHASVVPSPTADHMNELDSESSSKAAAQSPLQHSILEILRLCDLVRRARPLSVRWLAAPQPAAPDCRPCYRASRSAEHQPPPTQAS